MWQKLACSVEYYLRQKSHAHHTKACSPNQSQWCTVYVRTNYDKQQSNGIKHQMQVLNWFLWLWMNCIVLLYVLQKQNGLFSHTERPRPTTPKLLVCFFFFYVLYLLCVVCCCILSQFKHHKNTVGTNKQKPEKAQTTNYTFRTQNGDRIGHAKWQKKMLSARARTHHKHVDIQLTIQDRKNRWSNLIRKQWTIIWIC